MARARCAGRHVDTFCAWLGCRRWRSCPDHRRARRRLHRRRHRAALRRSSSRSSAFRRQFEAKGRLQPYLARIPTRVILHRNPAFLGLMGLLSRRSRARPARGRADDATWPCSSRSCIARRRSAAPLLAHGPRLLARQPCLGADRTARRLRRSAARGAVSPESVESRFLRCPRGAQRRTDLASGSPAGAGSRRRACALL